jgi:hypothetical protein
MKNSNDTIWNRTSDLPICATVPPRSGEWYGDHSPSDVVAKMRGAILHSPCTFKVWYLSDQKGKFDLTLENVRC